MAGNLVFVGSYTRPPYRGDGISTFLRDPATGKLELLVTLVGAQNPSFLALNPAENLLFCVDEKDPEGEVSSYSIDEETGQLKPHSRQPSGGGAPCHLCTDPLGEFLFVANHTEGNVAVFPIGKDGSLLPSTDLREHDLLESHAHFVGFDPSGSVLLVADKGTDKLMLYTLRRDKGCLEPFDPPFIRIHEGAAPRHIAFHPSGKIVYVNGEADCTISAHSFDLKGGKFDELQVVPTLMNGKPGESDTTAEIAVHPSGKWLYVTNRGKNSVTAFNIHFEGELSLLGSRPTGGKNPRHFAIDPSGDRIYVANQDSGTIVPFAIDQETGQLSQLQGNTQVGSPACLLFSSRGLR